MKREGERKRREKGGRSKEGGRRDEGERERGDMYAVSCNKEFFWLAGVVT